MASSQSSKHDLALASRIEVLFPVFATVVVSIRMGLRHKYKIALQWDDALITLSLLCTWALWGVWHWTSAYLIGDRETALRASTPPLLQKLCFAMDYFYGEGINIVKFAILVFYYRAFGSNPNAHKVRLGIWSLGVVVGLYTIARAVETVFLCPPACFGYKRSYDVVGWQFTMRAINWITEFAILIFPIPVLWSLTITTRRKVGIYVCFSIGILTCIASAGRLVSCVKLYIAQNAVAKEASKMSAADQQEWFYGYYIPQMSVMTLWALAELNAGIVAATLPAIRSPAISMTKTAVEKIRASKVSSNWFGDHGRANRTDTMGSDTTASSKTITPFGGKEAYFEEKEIP